MPRDLAEVVVVADSVAVVDEEVEVEAVALVVAEEEVDLVAEAVAASVEVVAVADLEVVEVVVDSAVVVVNMLRPVFQTPNKIISRHFIIDTLIYHSPFTYFLKHQANQSQIQPLFVQSNVF